MPNVMAAQPNIGGAVCESSVILFLVRRCKLSLTPTLLKCRAVTLPIQKNASDGRKVNFAPGKFVYGARAPENVYIYSFPVQEMAKHRAKFG